MDERARRRAYEVCRERGHHPSGVVLDSFPPQQVCQFCGVHYRYEKRLVEIGNIPLEDG